MTNGIFANKFSLIRELKIAVLTIIGFFITIINPISWVIYFIVYKIGKTAGQDRTTVKMTSQWVAFLSAIISYIAFIIYIVFKVNS